MCTNMHVYTCMSMCTFFMYMYRNMNWPELMHRKLSRTAIFSAGMPFLTPGNAGYSCWLWRTKELSGNVGRVSIWEAWGAFPCIGKVTVFFLKEDFTSFKGDIFLQMVLHINILWFAKYVISIWNLSCHLHYCLWPHPHTGAKSSFLSSQPWPYTLIYQVFLYVRSRNVFFFNNLLMVGCAGWNVTMPIICTALGLLMMLENSYLQRIIGGHIIWCSISHIIFIYLYCIHISLVKYIFKHTGFGKKKRTSPFLNVKK